MQLIPLLISPHNGKMVFVNPLSICYIRASSLLNDNWSNIRFVDGHELNVPYKDHELTRMINEYILPPS